MEEKIGVYVCECGPNISENIDIDRVLEVISSINSVFVADRHKLMCSGDGKTFLKEQIIEQGLTHLVVAACSPKQHEQTFMNVCEETDLNPYMFQLVNIREQCAWIIEDKEEATDKAIRQIKAAIRRVQYQCPFEKKEIDCNPDVLIIGGGIAGLEASSLLASPERQVYLVEKNSTLGGLVSNFNRVFYSMEKGSEIIEQKIQAVLENKKVKVFLNSEVEEVLGFFGNFEIRIKTNKETTEILKDDDDNNKIDTNININEYKAGAVVVAIGASLFDPSELDNYGYGKYDNVLTALEFEKLNNSNNIVLKNGGTPKSVGIIHCVGRKEKGYCSEICCLYSLKFARYLKEKVPDIKITHLYSDLCIPGKTYQKFYEDTKELGVDFVRGDDIEILDQAGDLVVNYNTEFSEKQSFTSDMVILSPAIVSSSNIYNIAEILNIAIGDEGFLAEEHEKIGPISTSIEGIYIAGCARGPKNITDSIVQSEAAAGKILTSLIPGQKIEPEVKTSVISEEICIGCQTCIPVCPYSAITYDKQKRISKVNEVICRGCGNCAAACPSGAASLKHFTTKQLYQELMEGVE